MNDNNNGNNLIANDFKFGKNFKIGNFCIIEEGCEVGDNVVIENFTHIKKGLKLGDNCYIGNYCEIGKNLTAIPVLSSQPRRIPAATDTPARSQ